MARIRTVKPEFWTDEKVVECSVTARLLFIGLWNFADDEGRIVDSPKQIKMKVFPGDDLKADDIHCLLTELSVNGLILRYAIDNKEYIQVVGWHHQKINRVNKSKIPPPPKGIHGVLTESHPPEGKGREKEGKGKETPQTPLSPSSESAVKFDCLLNDCFDAAELDPSKILNPRIHVGSTEAVKDWIAAGGDFAEHIKPAIREALNAGRMNDPGFHPKTLKYYRQAVLDRIAKANPAGEWEDTDTPQWRIRVGAWKQNHRWMTDLHGPPPDDPETLVPPVVLTEFGIASRA